MNQNSMLFIGLDLGDKHSHLAILDQNGDLIEETRLPTTQATFHRKFSTLPACRVAMVVGAHSRLIIHVRGIVKSFGDRLPSCSANYFAKKVASDIPEPLQPALMPILETVASLTQQIRAYDRQIVSLCQEQYPEVELLQPVAGVGALTSLAYVLTLEDPQRFKKSREVGPAVGLVPRRDQSGGHDPQLRITKTGDTYLRRLLVGSAQYILGPFGPDCLCPARVRPAPLGLEAY